MPRQTKLTDEKREKFCAELADGQSVTAAAKRIGVTRAWAYWHRSKDEGFAAEWDSAVEAGTDALEDEAVKRARNGSDTMLIFMLKGRRPEKFKERISSEVKGSLAISHEQWLEKLA
jgi:hypothetical protein